MKISDEMAAVTDAFVLKGPAISAEPYGEGHINDTYLVKTRGGGQYMMQRVNTHVFRDPVGLMDNIQAVTGYLGDVIRQEGGNPTRETLTLIPAKTGANHHRAPGGAVWRAYIFIDGAVSYQRVESPDLFAASAKAFALFAKRLNGFPAVTLHETIPKFHDTRKRLADFTAAVKADAAGRAKDCRGEIEFILARGEDCAVLMTLLEAGELPLRVTHNDTKLNNVLIDPATKQGVCVIDLDTVMPGLIANDFGDSIRFGAATAAEDERDLDRVHFSLPLYETFTQSYLEVVRDSLTEKEVEMLPWGAKLMTLECGMRFLADHLEGDLYFKVHRPGHNLDRARTQLKLVQEMEQNWRQMEFLTAKKL